MTKNIYDTPLITIRRRPNGHMDIDFNTDHFCVSPESVGMFLINQGLRVRLQEIGTLTQGEVNESINGIKPPRQNPTPIGGRRAKRATPPGTEGD